MWPVVLQGMLVVMGAAGTVLAPPATGRMLLVSLDGSGRNGLARVATRAGAALVDAGPFHDSLIVSGDRSALLGAMGKGRMLVLRAARGGCDGEGRGS